MVKNIPILVLFKDLSNDDGKKTDAAYAGAVLVLEVLPVFRLLFPTSCVE